ncbi:MAG: Hpt domain-containing protein [Myxococcaceae bacterium]
MGTNAQARPFNRELALQRIGNDLPLLKQVVGAFLEEVPVMLQALVVALENHDALALERAAHRIKGSLLTVAVERAAQCARDLETLAHTGQTTGAWGLLAKRHSDLRPALLELRALVGSGAEARTG